MAQNVIINGVNYQNVPEVDIPKSGGGTAKFYDTAAASTLSASHLLEGDVAFGSSGEIVGTMPNNGSTGGTISTKAGTVTIPAGYTSGGTVQLGGVSDCLSQNILNGKTILGVAGSLEMPTISQDATTKILSIS